MSLKIVVVSLVIFALKLCVLSPRGDDLTKRLRLFAWSLLSLCRKCCCRFQVIMFESATKQIGLSIGHPNIGRCGNVTPLPDNTGNIANNGFCLRQIKVESATFRKTSFDRHLWPGFIGD